MRIREAAADLIRAADDGRLEELCQRVGLSLVVLFGSAVLEDATPADLDIAVLPVASDRLDRVATTTAFIDLVHVDAIDLLDLSRAGVMVRAHALGQGMPLYESVEGLYARQQMRAVPMAMELGWLTALELELLADPAADH